MRSALPSAGSIILLIAALALSPCESRASTLGTDLYLPSVGSGPGVPPSVWYTTIWIFNPHDATAHVELSFLRRDQSNNPPAAVRSVEVTPGQVVQIDDAVATLFNAQGFGAIHAVADLPVLLFSRIYSKAAGQEDRDSSGQAFAAIPAERAIGTGQETDLIGLTNLVGGDFRYNVAFVETTGHEIWVQVELRSSSGSGWVSSSIHLLPYEQKQLSVDNLFNNAIGESDNFRLRATGGPGDGQVIVSGSRVANGSQDATTFEMTFP